MSEARVKRALWPVSTAWWARFLSSMVLPSPLGPTSTTLAASSKEGEREQLLDQGAVALGGPGPVEVGDGLEGAEARRCRGGA